MVRFARPLVLNDPRPDGQQPSRAPHAQAEDLPRQSLDVAARSFIDQTVTLDAGWRVRCSRMFRWYPDDFEAAGGIAPSLLRSLDEGPARTALAAASPQLRWTADHWPVAHEPVE